MFKSVVFNVKQHLIKDNYLPIIKDKYTTGSIQIKLLQNVDTVRNGWMFKTLTDAVQLLLITPYM